MKIRIEKMGRISVLFSIMGKRAKKPDLSEELAEWGSLFVPKYRGIGYCFGRQRA